MVTVPRSGYYQVALLIKEGSWTEVRAAGLAAFQRTVATITPFLADEMTALRSWDDVQLLSVQIDRLEKRYAPEFLAIGDAAHAMSPASASVSTTRSRMRWPAPICCPRPYAKVC